jgi:hypothetical protein
LDVKDSPSQTFDQDWLVTNTRFSVDAERYGECVGMGLLSWNFPRGNSLRERIDRNRLYPITCLTSLSKSEKQRLLDKEVVLCQAVCERPEELDDIGLSDIKKSKALEEARKVCSNQFRG